jgi:hypothetical protein
LRLKKCCKNQTAKSAKKHNAKCAKKINTRFASFAKTLAPFAVKNCCKKNQTAKSAKKTQRKARKENTAQSMQKKKPRHCGVKLLFRLHVYCCCTPCILFCRFSWSPLIFFFLKRATSNFPNLRAKFSRKN